MSRARQSLIAAPPEGGAIVGRFYPVALPRPRGLGFRAPEACPLHLQELVDALYLDVPPLLEGLDPGEVGVMLLHPDGDPCPGIVEAEGHIVACLKPLSWLTSTMAQARVRPGAASTVAPSPARPPRPGCFFAVLATREALWRWDLPRRAAADPRSMS